MTRKPGKAVSDEYVFKRDRNGRLQFVGDFESFYQDQADPWGQSGTDERLQEYYRHSRSTLIDMIARYPAIASVLEIGCGHGHVTRILADALPGAAVSGMDISATATKQARHLFPDLTFTQGDIAAIETPSEDTYDVVILNQMLWYVLDRLDNVFSNCRKMVSGGGLLVISTGFLRRQEYGLDIVNGFEGLLDLCIHRQSSSWTILEARYDDSGTFLHNDGVVVLRRT